MRYWVFQGSGIKGPFSPDEIRAAGGVSPESLVCEETLPGSRESDWKSAAEIGELSAAVSAAGAAEGPYVEPPIIPAAIEASGWSAAEEAGWPSGWSEPLESLVFLDFSSEELFWGGTGLGYFSWSDLPASPTPALSPAPDEPRRQSFPIAPDLGWGMPGAAVAPTSPPATPPAQEAARPEASSEAAAPVPSEPAIKLGEPKAFKLLEEPESGPQSFVEGEPSGEPAAPTNPEAAAPEPAVATEALSAPEPAAAPSVPEPSANAPAEAPPAAEGLSASLEPAFFSAEPEAAAAAAPEIKPSAAEAPPQSSPAALEPPPADDGPVGATLSSSAVAAEAPSLLSVGPSTQEVIARLAKPQTLPSKSAAPAAKKKTNQWILFGVIASLVVLAASWYLFWQNGAPKEETAPAVKPATAPPIAAAPAPTATPSVAPQALQGSASPLPVSPYPASAPEAAAQPSPSPAAVEPAKAGTSASDNKSQAIEMTKSYPLVGRRKSVGSRLESSFGRKGYKEEWSASPEGREGQSPYNFLVQYRVVSVSGRAEPKLYLFEVDLSRHTVKAENRQARRLWAPEKARAARYRSRSSSAAARNPRVVREIVIRPKSA